MAKRNREKEKFVKGKMLQAFPSQTIAEHEYGDSTLPIESLEAYDARKKAAGRLYDYKKTRGDFHKPKKKK